MKYVICIVGILCGLAASSQSVYDAALKDYYRFEYTKSKDAFTKILNSGKRPTSDADLIKTYYYLSMLNFELGETDQAIQYLFDGSDATAAKFGEESPEMALYYICYGKYFHGNEVYDTAILFYQSALESKYNDELIEGEIWANLGYAYDYNGQYDSALIAYKLAAEILEPKLGLYHPYTDWIYASMPFVASNSKNYKEEVNSAKKSLEIKLELWGSGTDEHRSALLALAIAYEHLGDAINQKKYFEEVLVLTKTLYGEKSEEYATNLSQLGNAYGALKEVDNAVKYNQQAYELMKKLLGEKNPKTLNLQRNIGNVLYDGGRYLEAKSYYEQNLNYQLKAFGKSSPKLIQPYEDVAQVNENLGLFDVALDYYNRAKSLKKDEFSKTLPQSYLALARISDAKTQYDQALKYLDQALLANLKFNDGSLVIEAFIKNNIGTVYNELADYNRALEYLNESLSIRENEFGRNSKEVVQSLSNIATTYYYQGLNAQSLTLYTEVKKLEVQLYGPNHPTVARTLSNLANVSGKMGQYSQEVSLLKEAEKIETTANGLEQEGLVSVYHNLVLAYSNQSNFGEAMAYSAKHKNLVSKLYGENSLQMADNLNALGTIYHDKGNTSEAISYFKQALSILKNLEKAPPLDLAGVYNNMGVAYLDFQEFSQAEDYLENALRIYLEVLSESHFEVVSTRMNLGLVAHGKSNYPKALEIFNSTLSTGKNENSTDSLFVATVYQNMALSQLMIQAYVESLASSEKALQIRKTILGPENPQVVDMYVNIGNLYIKEGSLAKAEKSFSEALKIIEKGSVLGNQSTVKLYLSLSTLYADQHDYKRAIVYSDKALAVTEVSSDNSLNMLHFIALVQKVDYYYISFVNTKDVKYLNAASGLLKDADQSLLAGEIQLQSEADKLEFSIWKNLMTNVGVKNALAKYSLHKKREDLEEAFYFAERSKANVLISAINETKAKSYAGIDPALLTRERELHSLISRTKEDLYKTYGNGDLATIDQLKQRLFDAERGYDEIKLSLNQNGKYRKLTNTNEIISLAELQLGLETDQSIIEFAASDSSLHTFVITKGEVEVFSKPYEDGFDLLITAMRNSIIFKSSSAFSIVTQRLYDLSLSDVEHFFEENSLSITDLTIVPEGPFNYFPFESLRRNDRYIIEDYDVHYKYSLTLDNLLEERGVANTSNSLLAFAPVFSDPNTSTLTSGARDVFAASRAVSSEETRGFSRNGVSISALPGTKTEVDALDELMKSQGAKSETLLYEMANEEVVKSGRLKDFSYLHFATHGFVNEATPAFSGVFLSQNQNSSEDCILFAAEIYNLELSADLVTLSACETGLGKFAYGEGIVGLTRAFLFAGAKNLLVSQWKVSDESTAKLMVDFYQRLLKGTNKSEALREAKLNLIKNPEFSAPYFWAPFVLIGE